MVKYDSIFFFLQTKTGLKQSVFPPMSFEGAHPLDMGQLSLPESELNLYHQLVDDHQAFFLYKIYVPASQSKSETDVRRAIVNEVFPPLSAFVASINLRPSNHEVALLQRHGDHEDESLPLSHFVSALVLTLIPRQFLYAYSNKYVFFNPQDEHLYRVSRVERLGLPPHLEKLNRTFLEASYSLRMNMKLFAETEAVQYDITEEILESEFEAPRAGNPVHLVYARWTTKTMMPPVWTYNSRVCIGPPTLGGHNVWTKRVAQPDGTSVVKSQCVGFMNDSNLRELINWVQDNQQREFGHFDHIRTIRSKNNEKQTKNVLSALIPETKETVFTAWMNQPGPKRRQRAPDKRSQILAYDSQESQIIAGDSAEDDDEEGSLNVFHRNNKK